MFAASLSTHRLDRMAIGLSGLCLVHCLASSVIVAVLASGGALLGNEMIHEGGLLVAMLLGGLSLVMGARQHGFMMPGAIGGLGIGVMGGALALPHNGEEVIATMCGVGIVALAHKLNLIAGD
ncbi:MerC domain-containing protein [Sphingomicrobium nitratireducens]|uniref:MerC domain-containing protein n=1 Tax=Sphingomicrobium nitratireducens TaxID=2964666 RepID=UPI00223F30A9|nr:MerC domain-containing protein [Sphingomicrobium nitratireducens]